MQFLLHQGQFSPMRNRRKLTSILSGVFVPILGGCRKTLHSSQVVKGADFGPAGCSNAFCVFAGFAQSGVKPALVVCFRQRRKRQNRHVDTVGGFLGRFWGVCKKLCTGGTLTSLTACRFLGRFWALFGGFSSILASQYHPKITNPTPGKGVI